MNYKLFCLVLLTSGFLGCQDPHLGRDHSDDTDIEEEEEIASYSEDQIGGGGPEALIVEN